MFRDHTAANASVTVSGAMTVAKMDRVLCEMIESGLAHMVVSTGAIMAHGLCGAIGGVHYKHDEQIPDEELYQRGYNRVYDTIELDSVDDSAPLFLHIQAVSRVRMGDKVGPGVLEQLIIGPHEPSGFLSFFNRWP